MQSFIVAFKQSCQPLPIRKSLLIQLTDSRHWNPRNFHMNSWFPPRLACGHMTLCLVVFSSGSQCHAKLKSYKHLSQAGHGLRVHRTITKIYFYTEILHPQHIPPKIRRKPGGKDFFVFKIRIDVTWEKPQPTAEQSNSHQCDTSDLSQNMQVPKRWEHTQTEAWQDTHLKVWLWRSVQWTTRRTIQPWM